MPSSRRPAQNVDHSQEIRMIKLSVFPWVPPFAQGLVRDLRVRWALEEAGLAYEEVPVPPRVQRSPEYLAWQPFGQVPAFESDELRLFESGAIVTHLAQQCSTLLPEAPAARARATAWMFAALNSVEPRVQELATIDLFHPNDEWARLRRPTAVEGVQKRLAQLATWLDGREHLEDGFTAGDLLMCSVLRILRHTDLVEQAGLTAYQERCEARPAFAKALADQLSLFERNAPKRSGA
jgi:glutathione S-transferase